MDAARYRRLRDLLHEAAERPAEERRAFLAAQAEGDDTIVGEVLRLLEGEGPSTHHVAPPLATQDGEPGLLEGDRLGRFRVRSEIGRGGMGVVYEAEDPESGAVVAVKVVRPRFLAVRSVRERFLREARLGLSIEHENVVRTHALEEAVVGGVGVHLLVMERVRGRTLRALLEEMGTLPEGLWREVALQAARGLAAVHEAGAVHRDVKPENVLLTDDRRVRVMDLGVARVPVEPGLTVDGQFVGSLRYASPEQVLGQDVGPSSDVWSLGVVLHELATGRPPFDGDGPGAPAALAESAPGFSDFACAVVGACLARRTEDRFPSARELAHALEEAEAGAWWEARKRTVRKRRAPRAEAPRRARFVGRAEERRELEGLWDAARRGEGRVALVLGEAGIGKTRLVEELLATEDSRTIVLRSEPAAGDDVGGLVLSLVPALGSDLEADVGKRLGLPAPLASELAAYLRRSDPASSPRTLGPAAADGLVLRLLQSLATEAPVLWVVEDAHAFGPDARRLLVTLARGLSRAAVLLVVTAEPGADPALLSALSLSPGSARLDLARLPPTDVLALAADVLQDPVLAAHLLPELSRRAEGVPLFALEILRAHAASGARATCRDVEQDPAPRALADLLRARALGLDPAERSVLEAAAVVGPEFDPGLVAAARGLSRLETLDVLGRLERRHGLVRSGPTLARFDHRLLREVLYADLSPALKAELHARVADAIEAQPAGAEPGLRAWRVAHHRLRGPEPARAVAIAVEAVLYGDRTHRKAEAYALARRAMEVAESDPVERLELVLHAAQLATTIGRATETAPILAEELRRAERTGDPFLLARLRYRVAAHGIILGRFDEALAAATAAVDGFREAGRAKEAADTLRVKGQALWCLGRLEESCETQREALRATEGLATPVLRARITADLGMGLHETGRLAESEAVLRDALAEMRANDDRMNLGTVESNLGNVLYDAGRRAEAAALYESSIEEDRALGLRLGGAVGWVNLGRARLSFGDLEGARAAFRLCEDLAREAAAPRVEAFATHGLASVAHWSGDRAEARRLYEGALRTRRAISHRPGIADTSLALGAIALEDGRTDDARAHLTEASGIADAVGDPSLAALARLRLALLGDVSPEAARAAFEAAGPRLRHDARLEGHVLLWRLTGDAASLREAKRLADLLRRDAPAPFRAAMLERVPLLREIASAPDPR